MGGHVHAGIDVVTARWLAFYPFPATREAGKMHDTIGVRAWNEDMRVAAVIRAAPGRETDADSLTYLASLCRCWTVS